MPPLLARALLPIAVLVSCGLATVAIVVASGRPPAVLVNASTASTSTPEFGILATGDATVSRKPDLAVISVGVDSQQSTAAAAQSDLAAKAARLIARIKTLGVPDKDLNTAGYWVGPLYGQGQTITGYRANEQLQVKWHNVDTAGKALDAVVQEGGATNISVSFGLADPKAAQAEARALAIADAKSKAQAMASAAGVKLGQVIRVSDLSSNTRFPTPLNLGAAAPSKDLATQVPVGELQVQVAVEVDYSIG